jgi:hypothetical protein
MPRLLRFIALKAGECSTSDPRDMRRVSSPPSGRSTLMTSAPMSARSIEQ